MYTSKKKLSQQGKKTSHMRERKSLQYCGYFDIKKKRGMIFDRSTQAGNDIQKRKKRERHIQVSKLLLSANKVLHLNRKILGLRKKSECGPKLEPYIYKHKHNPSPKP